MSFRPISEMLLVTGIGWVVSYNTIEAALKLLSLAVPIVFSTLVFVRDWKEKKKKKEEREKLDQEHN